MMDEKTKQIMAEIEEKQIQLDRLEDDYRELNKEMCDIEGICPRCRNWHYPHC